MRPIAAKAGICSAMRPWAGAARLAALIGALFELGFEADKRFGAWTVLNRLRNGERENRRRQHAKRGKPARQAGQDLRPDRGKMELGLSRHSSSSLGGRETTHWPKVALRLRCVPMREARHSRANRARPRSAPKGSKR